MQLLPRDSCNLQPGRTSFEIAGIPVTAGVEPALNGGPSRHYLQIQIRSSAAGKHAARFDLETFIQNNMCKAEVNITAFSIQFSPLELNFARVNGTLHTTRRGVAQETPFRLYLKFSVEFPLEKKDWENEGGKMQKDHCMKVTVSRLTQHHKWVPARCPWSQSLVPKMVTEIFSGVLAAVVKKAARHVVHDMLHSALGRANEHTAPYMHMRFRGNIMQLVQNLVMKKIVQQIFTLQQRAL